MKHKVKIVSAAVARTKTNSGDFCKQTLRLIYPIDETQDPYLAIEKLILSEQSETFKEYGFKELKTFKGKGLYLQIFSIKIGTLSQINDWIKSICTTN